jgi:Domain of unknown function (DUF4082)/Mo-co oxidoreductase dimerisation domain
MNTTLSHVQVEVDHKLGPLWPPREEGAKRNRLMRWVRLSFLILLCVAASFRNAHAQSCVNAIVCENALPGDTGWDPGSGDSSIQGFATDISVNVGGTISFKVSTNAKSYSLNIYRMGYYGGAGARKITTISPSVGLPQTQPGCLTNSSTNLIDCGNWSVSASWQVPSTAVSGIYFVNLTRGDTGGTSQMFFVVRNDASHSDILFSTSDETWQAYNDYGGHSLYGAAGSFDLNNRAYKVSYNRPYDTRNFEAATFAYNAEYPMVRWLESNGYDVSYFTNVDSVRNAGLLTNHKTLLSVGHDEYVSLQRRNNIEAARDAGLNLAFFSGNEVFWKTRWENSTDGSNTQYRTLVCYKETYWGSGTTYVKDPGDPPTWTGTWRDPTFSPPADGGRPENALTGTIFLVNGPGPDNTDLSMQVPAADGKMRFWRNTTIANQQIGGVVTLPSGTLGYEFDGDIDNGFRPAGLVPLSTSTYTMTDDLLLDYGATYGAGVITHHMTLYRAPSGALVFGAGTVQWAWGLDDNHDGGSNAPDSRMQQATVNLFADMGMQPGSLQSGLVLATKSTDTTPPTSTITSPAAGSTVQYGSPITITGTATDGGGGVVGAVEVSVDSGTTWHPATGRATWTYTWSPWALSGSATVMVRAVDDSGNIQPTPTSVTFTVAGDPVCPCSIWTNSTVPPTPTTTDTSSVEVGLKFRSEVAGFVTGVRFYKGAGNTGTHIGNLWTNSGAKLASVTFTNETASGWQQALFSSPVAISPNTIYVISYYAPNGGYADDEPFFANGVDSPPLHAVSNAVGGGNGRFLYAVGGGFPNATFNAANYWVDLVFTPSSAWSISGKITGGGGAKVTLSGTANAVVTADASGNYTFANVVNGNYTITPSATGFTFSPASQAATVSGASVTGVNFTATAVPTFSISGTVNGANGAATLTLSGADSAVVSSDPTTGSYSFSGLVNGTYTVTPSKSGFSFAPTTQTVVVNSANMTGVNFAATALPTWSISGTIAGGAGATVILSGTASATTTAGTGGAYTFSGLLNGTYTVTPTGTGLAFTPTSQNVTLSGANIAGVNFTAAQAISIWNNSTLPTEQSDADTSPVELGLKFRSDVAGSVTGVRFYKGPSNTGTHIGNLWSSAGVKLATVNFTGETASGWQQATFATPVQIAASTTYIISYYAPNGGYAADVNFFAASGVDSVPLHALANGTDGSNGVYLYATGGGFPTNTFNSTNYWVDLVFTSTPASTFSISGTLTNGSAATVTLSGAGTGTTTANTSGNYSFGNLANGTYVVTPSKTGVTFSPTNQSVIVNGANQTGINFTGTVAATFTISGTVSNGSGATITLSGAGTGTATADSSGNYSFANLANGTYTVAASKSGFTVSPASQSVTINSASVTGVNFTASAVPSWSISGTISGGAAATVTLSGTATGTVTADANGNYSFNNLANGTYTVTPSKSGFTFSPASQSLTVSGANLAGVNFTATAAAGLAMDAKVFIDQATASTTATTPTFSTKSANELLLAFISGDQISTPNTVVSSVTGGGLTWVLAKRVNTQHGNSEIWRAFAASPLTNVSVIATLSQKVSSSMTVLSFTGVDTTGTSGSGAVGVTAGGNATTGAPTASLVTTRNSSWVFGVGNDYDNAKARTPGTGQTIVHQFLSSVGDTYWVQMQNSTTPLSGTKVTINDTAPTGDQYNLSICAIQPAP